MAWISRNRTPLIAALICVVSLAWVALQRVTAEPPPAAAACATAPAGSQAPAALRSAEEAISWYQDRLKSCPEDQQAYSMLAHAYLQRARETGDSSLYSRAELAVEEALRRQPEDPAALMAAGHLALARHQFETALALGQRAVALLPGQAQPYGIIIDAQIELGQYTEAITSAHQMVDLRPDLSSYTRVSYLRELHGDLPGAIEAMERAASAGSPQPENLAWIYVQLGKLRQATGVLADAETEYRHALHIFPGYPYALAGLAQIELVRGNTDQARTLYEQAIERLPLPEFIIGLGELELLAGNTAAAEQQFALVEAIDTLYQSNGVATELEMALFLASYGDPAQALQRAEQAYAQRQTIHTADALAWALFKNGRAPEALAYSQEALRLGTADARLLYHAGMIAAAAGDHVQARTWLERALALNPFFSLVEAEQARAQLAQLSAAR